MGGVRRHHLSMDGLPYYRVRLGSRIIQCELEELLELATQKRIQSTTLIIPPFSRSWQAADTLIELSGRLVTPASPSASRVPSSASAAPIDPWSAWEDMGEEGPGSGSATAGSDGSGAEEDWEAELATEVDLAPLSGSAPPKRVEPSVLPEASIVPLEPEPPRGGSARQVGEPSRQASGTGGGTGSGGGRGKVIAFPRERSRRDTEGPHALATEGFPVVPPPLPPMPMPAPATAPLSESLRYSIHWGRLTAMTGAGLAVLAVVWFYVHDTASTTFPPHPASAHPNPALIAPPSPQSGPAAHSGVSGAGAVAAGDPYRDLEAELRSRMSIDLLDVHEAGDLTDALYIELTRLKLDLKSARAEVVAWSGRKKDEPEVAEFLIHVRSGPDRIDRDLGGVALIVGKYIQRYNLKTTRLEVYLENPDGRTSRWNLDPEATRSFYIQRSSLTQFLHQTLASGRTPQ